MTYREYTAVIEKDLLFPFHLKKRGKKRKIYFLCSLGLLKDTCHILAFHAGMKSYAYIYP